jgi:hypothetical protein
MTNLKNLLAGIAAMGIFAADAGAQVIREDQAPPPAVDPKSLPPQSPAAPTSAGAVIIKTKVDLLDKDRDGKVSRVEAAAIPELIKVFDKLDRDRDGALDQTELDAYVK